MDDLQPRVSHTEPRLQSFRSDRMEAWGIVLAILFAGVCFGSWSYVPIAAAAAGVLAAILLASTVISWAWSKLFKRHREGQR
jgi:hypothetical protein